MTHPAGQSTHLSLLAAFGAGDADAFALADAGAAYQRVLAGSEHRLFFKPFA